MRKINHVEATLCYRSSQRISLDFIGFEIPNKWAGYTINFLSKIIRYFKYTTPVLRVLLIVFWKWQFFTKLLNVDRTKGLELFYFSKLFINVDFVANVFFIITHYPKSSSTYCFGHEMPKGSSFPNFPFQDYSHSPSFFVLFIFTPEKVVNFSSRENKDIAEKSSRIKAVVSSAYKLSLVTLLPFLSPLIELCILIWLARGSTARTKSNLERGYPCLTPLCKEGKSEAYPLFTMQLVMLWYKCVDPVAEICTKVHCIKTSKRYPHFRESKAFSKSF